MRLFHGARQGTRAASANQQPGQSDPAELAKTAAQYHAGFSRTSPKFAAAKMHNDLAQDAALTAQGERNVPIHPSQYPTEGSDKQGFGGDAAVREPLGPKGAMKDRGPYRP